MKKYVFSHMTCYLSKKYYLIHFILVNLQNYRTYEEVVIFNFIVYYIKLLSNDIIGNNKWKDYIPYIIVYVQKLTKN